jgi:hypothetical protein
MLTEGAGALAVESASPVSGDADTEGTTARTAASWVCALIGNARPWRAMKPPYWLRVAYSSISM